MLDIEIPIPPNANAQKIERVIDRVLADAGLSVTLRDTLKKFPGCTHWHVKKGRERGTLEITFWPLEHRVWFTVHTGRGAGWIDEAVELLHRGIRRLL